MKEAIRANEDGWERTTEAVVPIKPSSGTAGMMSLPPTPVREVLEYYSSLYGRVHTMYGPLTTGGPYMVWWSTEYKYILWLAHRYYHTIP